MYYLYSLGFDIVFARANEAADSELFGHKSRVCIADVASNHRSDESNHARRHRASFDGEAAPRSLVPLCQKIVAFATFMEIGLRPLFGKFFKDALVAKEVDIIESNLR